MKWLNDILAVLGLGLLAWGVGDGYDWHVAAMLVGVLFMVVAAQSARAE